MQSKRTTNIDQIAYWCAECNKWYRHGCKTEIKRCSICGSELQSEIHLCGVSLKGAMNEFGDYFCRKMKHSGLVLYLILNPKVIKMLSGAKPVALELNLPPVIWHGRKFKTLDLVFEKKVQNRKNYYLVDAKSKKPNRRDLNKMREYMVNFKRGLGTDLSKEFGILSIIAYPTEPFYY
jgi:hypothetical protein